MPRRGPFLSMLAKPLAALAAAMIAAFAVVPLPAQEAMPRRQTEAARALPPAPLPDAKRTSHTLALPGRTLQFTASAGAIAIKSQSDTVLADVALVAYTIDGADPASRPVAFAFNGGPGSASTWLHLGALGPWRVPLTADTISGKSRPDLVDNAETWLDFADLVFIDPPGTGFSRIWPAPAGEVAQGSSQQGGQGQRGSRPGRGEGQASPGSGAEWFWSVSGDIATFRQVIATWLERNGRKASPVVLVGESYGGFRAPLTAEALASADNISASTLVLVSPVLDFDGRRGWRPPQHYAAMLPSIAATHLERTGAVPDRSALAEAESYARSDYLLDLMRGPRDLAAVQRMSGRVAALSGIEIATVQQFAARFSIGSFVETSPDLKGKVVSIYDAGMTGLMSNRDGRRGGFSDPFTAGLDPPLTTAMGALHARLDWRPDRPYVMLSNEINRRWQWPNAPHPPQALSALHNLHRKDPRLRTLVVHGYTDLVTPYFATQMQIDQLPAHGGEQRIALEVYPGGHMFYSRDGSRARLRADVERLLGESARRQEKQTQGIQRETP